MEYSQAYGPCFLMFLGYIPLISISQKKVWTIGTLRFPQHSF